MKAFFMGGSVRSALTHFALYGLADIIEQAGGQARLGWTDEGQPRGRVLSSLDAEEIATAVLTIARRDRDATWVNADVDTGGRVPVAAFSPRVKTPSVTDRPGWRRLQRTRHAALDELDVVNAASTLRLIDALGEPSHWHMGQQNLEPDRGASRWEMKTRNRGEEFISHRYRPLCHEVADWPTEHIIQGLTGEKLRDPLGKDRDTSRSSSGLTTPGPADNAMVYCALRGIAQFPLGHRGTAGRWGTPVNATPGVWPNEVTHPRNMALPALVGEVTPARLRAILVSAQMDLVHRDLVRPPRDAPGESADADRTDPALVAAARAWLRQRRVPAVIVFPILKTGSGNAPERQVQSGKVHVL